MPDSHAVTPPSAERFPPIDKATLPGDQRAAYDLIVGRRGALPAPYATLLASPEAADLFEQYSSRLWHGVLPNALLEAVFLATAQRCGCRYQWMNHVKKAAEAGLDSDAIAAIGRGELPTAPEDVAQGLRFAEMLHRDHAVSQPVFDAVAARFGQRGVVELTAFCGFATSVAMLLNVRQITLPAGEPAPF
jgi:4-carboxymuconolactone decarboxylase